ncbi:hypothetical protein L2E82_32233 [Cichorium intybus]|uniref:Uncharacterized protein n=1 Tax=Cichorium intybus TaxID=13427 RepID=A0ACB9BGN4_CICIN|nr:hypothetical protein L2E82_32233 [Cichorium intybus]
MCPPIVRILQRLLWVNEGECRETRRGRAKREEDLWKQVFPVGIEEFPFVWYRAKGLDGTTATTFRDLVLVNLASAVWVTVSIFGTSFHLLYPTNITCTFM